MFYASCRNGNWDDFRNHLGGTSYNQLKEIIFQDQGGLCGYCEDSVAHLDKTKKQIEHFHDKSDKDLSITNWALDWNNVFGVCKGGSDQKELFPTPKNLSCDAHKNHFLASPHTEGVYLNPLDIPYLPIFSFDKATGFLIPNVEICQILDLYEPNCYDYFIQLVEATIQILNLNCDRLVEKRLAVLYEYNRLISRARENNNLQIRQQLTQHWFQQKWLPFFTVRRCLLSPTAEQYLAANEYGTNA